MEQTLEKTVGQIVAEDYRTAQVFKNHKIDFCCRGNSRLEEVAETNNLDLEQLRKELEQVQNQEQGDNIDFERSPLDLLADYVEKKHHRYVEQQIPVLRPYLEKRCKVHGDRHP